MIALLVLALIAVTLSVLPTTLTRWAAEFGLSRALRASVVVGHARFDLRKGQLTLEEIVVRELHEDRVLGRARQLIVDADWERLTSGTLAVELARIDAPELLLRFDEQGRFNWAGLLARPEVRAPPSIFWIELARIEVHEGLLQLEDESDAELPSLRVDVGGFALVGAAIGRHVSTEPLVWGLESAETTDWSIQVTPSASEPADFEVEASAGPKGENGALPLRVEMRREGGVHLGITGEIRTDTLDMNLKLEWEELHSEALFPFLGFSTTRVIGGTSTGELAVELSLDAVEARGLRAAGHVAHHRLELEHERPNQVATVAVELTRVDIELTEFFLPIPIAPQERPGPIRLHLSKLDVDAPRTEVTLTEETGRPESTEPLGDESPVAGARPRELSLRVDSFSVEDGVLRVRDATDRYRQELVDISIGTRDIHWPQPDVGRIEARLESRGTKALVLAWILAELGDRGPVPELPALDFVLEGSAGPVTSDGSLPLHIALNRQQAVHFDVDGTLRTQPLDVRARVRWDELRSAAALALLPQSDVRVLQGHSQGDFNVRLMLPRDTEGSLRAAGGASHRDLHVEYANASKQTRAALRVPLVRVDIGELYLPLPQAGSPPGTPLRLHVTHVHVDSPDLDAHLASAPTVGAVPIEVPPDQGGGSLAPPLPIDVQIDELSLARGRLQLSGDAVGAKPQALTGVEFDAQVMRWPDATAEHFDLRLGSLGTKPLHVGGSWLKDRASARLQATSIDLVSLDSVIRRHTSYSVSRGTLSLRSELEMTGRDYLAPTLVTTHRLEAQTEGNQFQKTFGVPFTTAISLLTDPADNIKLNIPIEGTLSEGSRVEIEAVVADALQAAVGNAISSAVATPLDLTGSALRRVGEIFSLGIGEAAFNAGESVVNLDVQVILSSAATIVLQKDSAKIELVPEIVSDDLQALDLGPSETSSMDTLIAVGRTIFGGGKALETDESGPVYDLSKRRIDSVTNYLEAAGLEGRIVAREWDGKVREGTPRVKLRMHFGD